MDIRCPKCSRNYRWNEAACPRCCHVNVRSPERLVIMLFVAVLACALIVVVAKLAVAYSTQIPNAPAEPLRPKAPPQDPVFGTTP